MEKTEYKDIMELETDWDGGSWAEFATRSGPLAFAMYDRKRFAEAVGESYSPPKGINLTMEVGFWLPNHADVDSIRHTEFLCGRLRRQSD